MFLNSNFITTQWSSLFADFTTVTGSCSFLKKILAVSFSAMTYMRGIFPDRAYGERYLGGLKLKILTENSKIEEVDKFINLIRSCYDAIDKKYLQQISIGICLDTENRDEVLESYSMTLRYNDDEFSISNKSGPAEISEDDPTVGATFWLLKSILQISDILSPIPQNAYLTMKLLYNDEITPEDYEPPGFAPAANEKFSFPTTAVKLKLGGIATDFHECKMYIKTALSREPLSQLIERPTLTESQLSIENIRDEPCEDDDCVIETEPRSTSVPIKDSQLKSSKVTPTKILCPCNCKQDSGIDVLECIVCHGQHHSACYGFLDFDTNESKFYCIQCINEAPSKNTERNLIYVYKGKQQQELCVLRLALVFCASVKQVTAFQLEKGLKCDKQMAKDIIERLEFEGFIRKSGLKYIVNENKIKNNGYQEYFSKSGNKENLQKRKLRKPKNFSPEIDTEISPSQNDNFRTKEQLLDQYMDFDIDNEVEKMDIKGSSGKRPLRTHKRKILKNMVERNDDSEEMFLSSKRRCVDTKEGIKLRK